MKEYAGVDPQTGKALYYMNTQDANGNYDRTVTTDASAAQAIPYKSVDPKISGGFTNIVNYKWFDLALTLTYSLGGYSFDKPELIMKPTVQKSRTITCPFMNWIVGKSRVM